MMLVQRQALHQRGLDSKTFESGQQISPPARPRIPLVWRFACLALFRLSAEDAHTLSLSLLRKWGKLHNFFRSFINFFFLPFK